MSAETTVNKCREFFLSLSEVTFEGLILLKHDQIIDVNKQILNIFLCKKVQLINHSMYLFIEQKEHHLLDDLLQNKHTECENTCELSAQCCNGKALYLELRICREIAGVNGLRILAVRNITEKKQIELNLRNAKEEAKTATQVKNRFLANISHELRTPMNGVVGMTELLLNTPLSTQQCKYATAIQKSANSLLDLINEILDYSKIESGKIDLEIIPFDLYQLADDIIQLLSIEAEKKSIQTHFNYHQATPHFFLGDPVRIRQIITNLLGNAIKFTNQGQVTLEIESLAKENKKHYLQLTIEDTGIGISEDKLSIIFDQFTQADASTTRYYGGTGLGLAICKNLIDCMDGDIQVQSTRGKGSRFTVLLTLDETEQVIEQVDKFLQTDNNQKMIFTNSNNELPDDPKSSMPIPPSLIDVRILVVEDQEINRMVVYGYLTDTGCYVDVAENGQEALEKIQKNQYDMVFMDVHMPVMDGLQATVAIRRLEQSMNKGHIPIVAMTANAMEGDRERCLEVGMDNYLAKPLLPEKVGDMVLQYCTILSVQGKKTSVNNFEKEQHNALQQGISTKYRDVFNIDDALTTTGGNKECLKRMIDVMVEDISPKIEACWHAYSETDLVQIQHIAHTLKGNAGHIGAWKLYDNSERLEKAAKQNEKRQIETLIFELQQILLELKVTLEAIDWEVLENA